MPSDGVNLISVKVENTAPSNGGTTKQVELTVSLLILANNELEAIEWLVGVLAEG